MAQDKSYAPSKTLSPENQAKIRCPVFPADVKIATCFELRDLVTRGEKVEVRKGCQAALHASKCPINWILKRMIRQGCDPYHADTPKTLTLDTDDTDPISRVLVLDTHMRQAGVGDKERLLLEEANERAREGGKLARRATRKDEPAEAAVSEPAKPAVAEVKATDMAAAINAEMEATK